MEKYNASLNTRTEEFMVFSIEPRLDAIDHDSSSYFPLNSVMGFKKIWARTHPCVKAIIIINPCASRKRRTQITYKHSSYSFLQRMISCVCWCICSRIECWTRLYLPTQVPSTNQEEVTTQLTSKA